MNRQLWKKAGLRALIGAPVGLAISTAITIIISFAIGDGKYYAAINITDNATLMNVTIENSVDDGIPLLQDSGTS